jgi:hypothetical protein
MGLCTVNISVICKKHLFCCVIYYFQGIGKICKPCKIKLKLASIIMTCSEPGVNISSIPVN